MHSPASRRQRQGIPGGEENRDSELVREWSDDTGGVVTGRTTYDLDEESRGDDPPFRTPVPVLTHRPRPALVKGVRHHFRFRHRRPPQRPRPAKAVAGGGDVDIVGGASTVRQHLGEGLIGELQPHAVPVLLGAAPRFFEESGAERRTLDAVRVVGSPVAVHLRYRFGKQDGEAAHRASLPGGVVGPVGPHGPRDQWCVTGRAVRSPCHWPPRRSSPNGARAGLTRPARGPAPSWHGRFWCPGRPSGGAGRPAVRARPAGRPAPRRPGSRGG